MIKNVHLRQIIWLFIFGATVGPVCDAFHTYYGVTYYPNPWIFKMAWWVPAVFGIAAVIIGVMHYDFGHMLNRPKRPHTWSQIIFSILAFMLLYFVSAASKVPNDMIAVILFVGGGCLFWVMERTWQGVFFVLLTAFIGTSFEIYISSKGLFYYYLPDFLGVPIWLPFLYISVSVAVGNLARKIASS